MRILVIGATGHIGSYLVPRLVKAGHEVIAMSRGERQPYVDDDSWQSVEPVLIDRGVEDEAGTFGAHVLRHHADAVIDLLCFTRSSAQSLLDALRDSAAYLLHCGTIWVHGPGVEVPTTEDAPRRPFGAYGIEKAEIERLLIAETRSGRLRATVLHPGHIVGPGWHPVGPAGNFSLEAFRRLAQGEELALPCFGLETVHHVHADDVAHAFELALDRPSVAVGESFHVVSPRALTLRGYAEAVASWFGQPARLRYLPWDSWRSTVGEQEADDTLSHVTHSPCMSIEKARDVLGYTPRYSSLEAVHESVAWLVADGALDTGGRSLSTFT